MPGTLNPLGHGIGTTKNTDREEARLAKPFTLGHTTPSTHRSQPEGAVHLVGSQVRKAFGTDSVLTPS